MSLKCILQGQTAQPSDVLPKSPGVAAIGDSALYARADHVHPQDNAKLDKTGGTMTGPLILKDNPAEDLEAATKQYVDNHTSDVVLYTPQTLSDEQKAQARENINSAPSEFGLGQVAYGPTFDGKPYNADGITGSGFFMCKNGTPTADWGAILHIQFDNKKRAIQFFDATFEWSGITDITKGTLFKREKFESTWEPWEYINPPMAVGVEYRTTERYQGKPVYTKVVDFGASPNNGVKNVSLGVSNVDKVCGASFYYYVPSTGDRGIMVSHPYFTGFLVSNNAVQIRTNTDKTDTNFYVTIKYTKTTD